MSSSLIQRLEAARKALGWSQRKLGREAGLKHDSHYSVLLANFTKGGGAHSVTVDLLVARLIQEGWSEEWLRRGTGHERAPNPIPQPLVAAAPIPRSFTPTPAPQSQLRMTVAGHRTVHPLPTVQVNRERAKELLTARGYDASELDEQLAMIAFDARLAPCEDRPVSWWIDCLRVRLQV